MIKIKTNNITGRLHHSSVFAEEIWRATDAEVLIHLNASSMDFGLITAKKVGGVSVMPNVHLNSPVPFCSALVSSIRDNPELYHEIASSIDIKTQAEFNRVKKNLKSMYDRARSSLDHDIVLLDEDDYCTMGVLYSILMQLSTEDSKAVWADNLGDVEVLVASGLQWHGDGRPPLGQAGLANLKYHTSASANLAGITISEMDWKHLLFRTVGDLVKAKKKAHFVMEVSSLEAAFPTPESLYELIESYYSAATIRGHEFTIFVDKTEENLEYLQPYITEVQAGLYKLGVPGSRKVKLNTNLGFTNQAMVIF